MDLKVNNVGFKGKKEVLYGLEKAAKFARNYERLNAVYSRTSTKYEDRAAYHAYVAAYLDMALRDSSFAQTIKELSAKEISPIKDVLTPETTQYAVIKPMNKFTRVMEDIVNSLGRKKKTVQGSVSSFYEKLGL